ncbi:LysR family transcriptional regulator [Streptomyces varsoviensis]|nr:LysR family transcriptional regulator [Streptomyces varsoviensis]
MDLVGACRAFVSVGEHGSFTVGAAAARMSQSVASRRVAALEERLGEQLFQRTSRRAVLTAFGRDLLPAARDVVRAAEVLLHEAEAAKHRPWRLAVPETCSTTALARLVAEARRHGVTLEPRRAAPARRREYVHSQQVRAALLAVPPDEATWTVPLGLAAAEEDHGVKRLYLETLRAGRASTGPPRRVWLQPEDDVPHIRDPLTRLRDALGLRPAQLVAAPDLMTAAAEVLCGDDLLLCSPAQADELALAWRPIGEVRLSRGFALLTAADGGDPPPIEGPSRIEGPLPTEGPFPAEGPLGDAIARCLGADHRARATGPTGPTSGRTTA